MPMERVQNEMFVFLSLQSGFYRLKLSNPLNEFVQLHLTSFTIQFCVHSYVIGGSSNIWQQQMIAKSAFFFFFIFRTRDFDTPSSQERCIRWEWSVFQIFRFLSVFIGWSVNQNIINQKNWIFFHGIQWERTHLKRYSIDANSEDMVKEKRWERSAISVSGDVHMRDEQIKKKKTKWNHNTIHRMTGENSLKYVCTTTSISLPSAYLMCLLLYSAHNSWRMQNRFLTLVFSSQVFQCDCFYHSFPLIASV